MKIHLLAAGTIAALAVMAGKAAEEKLAEADGKVSAQTLPLDKDYSKVKYETATFGLG